jgi:LacI family transcriptional regulator
VTSEPSKRPQVLERITYADIARHAGVSTASVSRALANEKGVSAEVADRVRESAAALGYRGNRAARALRLQRADAIGLLVPDVENPFFASITREVEAVASIHGHTVLLCNTGERVDVERRYLDLMIGENVAGVIAVPSGEELEPLLALVDAGIATVIVDRQLPSDPFDTVLVDHCRAAREVVEHLLGHGHRHIGAITTTTTETGGRERLRGCREAVDAAGARLTALEALTSDVVGVARTYALAAQLARDLMDMSDAPTALFCSNGLLSVGAYRGLRRSGRRVPDDVALVGVDDAPFFDVLEAPLTVSAQPTEEIARKAANVLYERIADPALPTFRRVVPPELRVRGSCGCSYDVAAGIQ